MIATLFARCYCATQPGVVAVVARNLDLLGHPDSRRSAPRVFENYARTLADYFWLAGSQVSGVDEPGTDVAAVSRGRISVTPLKIDNTDHSALQALHSWKL